MDEESLCKLFVRNLSFETNHYILKQFFSQYGPVRWVKIVCEKGGKVSKGFGFVVFADTRSARKALVESCKELQGRTIECFWASTGEPGTKYATAEEEVCSFLNI